VQAPVKTRDRELSGAIPRLLVTIAALVAIGAGTLLAGPRVSPADARIAKHTATARSADAVARGATVSDEAEEEDEQEQEETAAEKTHEEVVTGASRHEGEVAVEKQLGGGIAAKPALVTIERVRVTASGLLVTIETSRAGTVTFTGAGLRRTVERLPAKVHDVKVRFSRGGRTGRRYPRRTRLAVSLRPTSRSVSSSKEISL
jgi:hypothetical protein